MVLLCSRKIARSDFFDDMMSVGRGKAHFDSDKLLAIDVKNHAKNLAIFCLLGVKRTQQAMLPSVHSLFSR